MSHRDAEPRTRRLARPWRLFRTVRRGRPATVLAALACLVALASPVHAQPVGEQPASGPGQGAGDPVRLRVMAYNIHAGAGADGIFDLERVAQAIEAERPDAVALQEVDVAWSARSAYVDEATWLARRLGMEVFFAPIYTLAPDRPGAPPRQYGLAVLSRHPILRAHNHEITRLSTQVPDPTPAPAPGFPEVLISAHGAFVWLYGTHLDYRADPAIRHTQIAETKEIMARRHGPKMLLGDFNAEPDAPELAPLWKPLDDALAVTGNGSQLTYPAAQPVKRLDYVTVSTGTTVKDAWVPGTLASDHLPVVADVELTR